MTRAALAWTMALTVCALHAQQVPRRDIEAKPTFGTASISGVVVDDENPPRPVRRVVVTLSGGTLRPSRGAITDDDGSFTIESLPAGSFTLTVSRASFITSAYGARRPGRQGTPIAVADGQHVEGLQVTLWRGAAMAGTITDETGAPVSNIPVTAIPARTGGATLVTLSDNPTRTDHRGEFRIFGLEPGTYLLSVTPLASGGGVMTAPSEREVDAQLAAVYRRGAAPPLRSAAVPEMPSKHFTYAPVFYPGTPSVTAATAVTLVPGKEAVGLDFSLQRVGTSIVEGVVRRPDGTPAAGATVQLTAVMPPDAFGGLSPVVIRATAGSDGLFRMPQVTPGDYKLMATASGNATPQVESGFAGPGPPASTLYAQSDVSVMSDDISGLAVYLEPGITITGRLRFEGVTKPPSDLTKIQVRLRPKSPQGGRGISAYNPGFSAPASVRADGTLLITNVCPGTYVLSTTLTGNDATGWWSKSAILGEVDLLDGPVEIGRDAPKSLVVTFSDRRTELSGSVQKATEAAPAEDVFVVAYAADHRFWLPSGRRIKAIRPDAEGHYVIRDLPAGEYRVAVVAALDEDALQDAAFLDALAQASEKVTLAEGEKMVLNLRFDVR